MDIEPNTNIVTKSDYSIPIAIILAGVIIAITMFFGGDKSVKIPEITDKVIDNKPVLVNISNVKIEDEPYVGNPNAPVVIAVWFDYQCPACKYNELNLISPLVEEYVKSGKVKIVFKDFSFLGKDSLTLALTARAIWEAYPEKFYEWQKVIFTNQGNENTGWATKTVIINLTKQVSGIDQSTIDDLLVKNDVIYNKKIEDDRNEGIKFGINSTPSFIIGDTLQAGVPQYSVVKSIIDSMLK